MSQLSYVSGELHLRLDDSHKRNRIILSFLKNTIGFKERNGILILRKSDAKTILRVKKIVPNLILDKKCEQIIKEYRETEANFETLLEEGRKIKEKPDCALVLDWNFFDEIKKNNRDLADKFVSIKDLEI